MDYSNSDIDVDWSDYGLDDYMSDPTLEEPDDCLEEPYNQWQKERNEYPEEYYDDQVPVGAVSLTCSKNRKLGKTVVRLTESDLHRIIMNTVRKLIS